MDRRGELRRTLLKAIGVTFAGATVVGPLVNGEPSSANAAPAAIRFENSSTPLATPTIVGSQLERPSTEVIARIADDPGNAGDILPVFTPEQTQRIQEMVLARNCKVQEDVDVTVRPKVLTQDSKDAPIGTKMDIVINRRVVSKDDLNKPENALKPGEDILGVANDGTGKTYFVGQKLKSWEMDSEGFNKKVPLYARANSDRKWCDSDNFPALKAEYLFPIGKTPDGKTVYASNYEILSGTYVTSEACDYYIYPAEPKIPSETLKPIGDVSPTATVEPTITPSAVPNATEEVRTTPPQIATPTPDGYLKFLRSRLTFNR